MNTIHPLRRTMLFVVCGLLIGVGLLAQSWPTYTVRADGANRLYLPFMAAGVEPGRPTTTPTATATRTAVPTPTSLISHCPPNVYVYPIAVPNTTLDANGFLPPSRAEELAYYKLYSDENFPDGRYQRRLYLADNGNAFAMLRWRADPCEAGSLAVSGVSPRGRAWRRLDWGWPFA